jgi:hypothetical protein
MKRIYFSVKNLQYLNYYRLPLIEHLPLLTLNNKNETQFERQAVKNR